MLERYPNNMRGEYVLCPNNGYCIDGAKTNSSSIRFANDARQTPHKNNAVFKQGSDVLRAGPQGIPANREVFVSYMYGSAYVVNLLAAEAVQSAGTRMHDEADLALLLHELAVGNHELA
jgi:hypothetical protein